MSSEGEVDGSEGLRISESEEDVLGWGEDVGGVVSGAGVEVEVVGCGEDSLDEGGLKSLPIDCFSGGKFGLGASFVLLP